MASKYDNIETAKDLVSEVAIHGLSMAQEDICRAQDIFGGSSVKELDFLANDIGRDDDNGNPDPNGRWASGRRGTRRTFYMILANIWSFDDVTRFWNQHTNPEHKELKELQTKLRDEMREHGETKHFLQVEISKTAAEHERYLEASRATAKEIENVRRLEAEVHDLNMQIMELKAKMYDMIAKEDK